jgi:hypothetical protein
VRPGTYKHYFESFHCRVVRARKCVREDRVAEGVPAPRGKSLEIRGFGGKLSYEILFHGLSKGKQGSI